MRATLCYMKTVSQRQMRNQSAELLRAVEGGESFVVTNNGKPVAVVSPYADMQSPLERARSLGQTRPAQASVQSLREIQRRRIGVSSAELLRESRGEW